jgi:hypothetical protein
MIQMIDFIVNNLPGIVKTGSKDSTSICDTCFSQQCKDPSRAALQAYVIVKVNDSVSRFGVALFIGCQRWTRFFTQPATDTLINIYGGIQKTLAVRKHGYTFPWTTLLACSTTTTRRTLWQ